MGELRKYKVKLNGNDTVLKLSDAELKLYPDAVPVDDEPAAPDRKARTAANKRRGADVETK